MYVASMILEPPETEPVALATAKAHLRVDTADSDLLIQGYLAAARELAENYTGRAFVTQKWRYSISDSPPGPQWPLTAVTPVILPMWLPYPLLLQSPIRLNRFPIQSIDRVATSATGQLTDKVLNPATDYSYDLTGAPVRLLLQPSAQPQIGQHVLIDYTAGYEDPTLIPQSILLAILFGTAWLYEHRGDDGGELPQAFYALLTPHRLFSFGG